MTNARLHITIPNILCEHPRICTHCTYFTHSYSHSITCTKKRLANFVQNLFCLILWMFKCKWHANCSWCAHAIRKCFKCSSNFWRCVFRSDWERDREREWGMRETGSSVLIIKYLNLSHHFTSHHTLIRAVQSNSNFIHAHAFHVINLISKWSHIVD